MKKVPNLLSIIRICLVPVFILAYFYEQGNIKIYAALVYALASITDFLDGFIARKYNLITETGKILDPIGDKLMTLSVITCVTVDGMIPAWVLVLVLLKETLMISGGAFLRKKAGGEIPSSNIIGKSSTVMFFLVFVSLMLFHDIPRIAVKAMITAAICLMFVAFGSYIVTFKKIMDKVRGSGQ